MVSIVNADSDHTLFWGKSRSWSKVKLRAGSMLKVSGIVGWLGRVDGETCGHKMHCHSHEDVVGCNMPYFRNINALSGTFDTRFVESIIHTNEMRPPPLVQSVPVVCYKLNLFSRRNINPWGPWSELLLTGFPLGDISCT